MTRSTIWRRACHRPVFVTALLLAARARIPRLGVVVRGGASSAPPGSARRPARSTSSSSSRIAPEPFHMAHLQDAGRLIEVREPTVFMMDVPPDELRALASHYWVRASSRGRGSELAAPHPPRRARPTRPALGRARSAPRGEPASGASAKRRRARPAPRPLAGLGAAGRAVRLLLPGAGDVARAFVELIAKGILPVYVADSLPAVRGQRRRRRAPRRRCWGWPSACIARSRASWRRSSTSSSRSSRWPGSRSSSSGGATASRSSWCCSSTSSSSRCSTTPWSASAPSRRSTSTRCARWARGLGRWSPRSILPAALPGIITGFRVGAGFAFRGLIFAEMVAAKTGVGYLIFEGAQTSRPRGPSSG